jgi:hypothetical protein
LSQDLISFFPLSGWASTVKLFTIVINASVQSASVLANCIHFSTSLFFGSEG